MLALPASYDGPSGLVVQPDGRLVVAGTTNAGGVHDFLVARFEPEGALDSSFAAGGVATTPSGSDGYALGLVRQVDAKLVVVAETRVAGAPAFGLLRYVGEPACGDGLLDPGEECDDGNTAAGDCCGPTCALEADTSPCDDGNACTEGDACTAGVCAGTASVVCEPCEACAPASGCVATPQSGCNSPLRAGGARLALTEGPSGRNRLTWTWGDGVASSLPTLGDPLTTDDLTLCIYDGTGPTPGLLLSATAPAGGTCSGVPCWRQIAVPGFRYVDRARAAGGLSTLAVRAAAGGTARAKVKAGGPTLSAPALPLAGSIRVQLRSEAGGCWEAVHPTQRATRNDASRFVCTGE